MSEGLLKPKTLFFLFSGSLWLLECSQLFSVLFLFRDIAELFKDKYSNYR